MFKILQLLASTRVLHTTFFGAAAQKIWRDGPMTLQMPMMHPCSCCITIAYCIVTIDEEDRSDLKKRIMITSLLGHCIDPKSGDCLVKGAYGIVAQKIVNAGWKKVTRRSVQNLWLAHLASILYPEKYNLNVSREKGSGRKHSINVEELRAKVKGVCFSDR